jgi:hypothetical protein
VGRAQSYLELQQVAPAPSCAANLIAEVIENGKQTDMLHYRETQLPMLTVYFDICDMKKFLQRSDIFN